MTIKIDLRKILQAAQNKARSGIPMDEAISMAVWDHFADQESANTAMAMVSTALLEFDSGKAGTLEEAVQNMLQAIETSAHPGIITEEIESEHDEKSPDAGIENIGTFLQSASGGPNPVLKDGSPVEKTGAQCAASALSPVKLESGVGKLIFLIALAALVYWLL